MVNIRISIKEVLMVIVLMITVFSGISYAFPPLPSQYHGTIRINNELAIVGTIVNVFDSANNTCGTFTIQEKGQYIISCKGDDLSTAKDEGVLEDEIIFLQVGNYTQKSYARWSQGSFTRLNLWIFEDNFTNTSLQPSPIDYESKSLILLLVIFTCVIIFIAFRAKALEKNEE